MAELTLSSGALNDTDGISRVFDRLEEGDAFENVDEFLTLLTSKGQVIHVRTNCKVIAFNWPIGKMPFITKSPQRIQMDELIG